MNVSLIGTNGLLSKCIGRFCNQQNYNLDIYGRNQPSSHAFRQFIKTDLLTDELIYENLIKSDLIIYAAGAGIQSGLHEDISSIYNLNAFTPINIFNSLKKYNYGGKFVTFGSYFEIGENIENILYSEVDILNSLLKAPNDYTVSKRVLSRFFSSAMSSYNFYHFILPTIYGEEESQNRLIPYTLKAIYENTDLSFTSGDQIRQYIYINDVIDVIFNSNNADLKSGIYNVEGVEEFSVKELVRHLFSLTSKQLPADVFGKAERKDVGMKVLKLDGEKLQQGINYTPITKISDVYGKYNFE